MVSIKVMFCKYVIIWNKSNFYSDLNTIYTCCVQKSEIPLYCTRLSTLNVLLPYDNA